MKTMFVIIQNRLLTSSLDRCSKKDRSPSPTVAEAFKASRTLQVVGDDFANELERNFGASESALHLKESSTVSSPGPHHSENRIRQRILKAAPYQPDEKLVREILGVRF